MSWRPVLFALPLAIAAPICACAASAGITAPAEFRADRVFLHPHLGDGSALSLYTDTGGGGSILTADAARRAGLESRPIDDPEMKAELGPDTAQAPAPAFTDPGLPPMPGPVLVVTRAGPMPGWPETQEGLVGNNWFAGHVWTWDYPGRRLVLEAAGWRPPADASRVGLGFRTRGGARVTNFPRIVVRVAGEDLSMLLDTGAETWLTPEALAALADNGPAVRATSMVVAGKVAAWRAAHPGWRVIEKAQARTGSRMIEVPQVSIAGIEVGPVWFTERPDANFHAMMSSGMDAQVEGAIGGNALRSLVMTIDYPGAAAWFEKAAPAP